MRSIATTLGLAAGTAGLVLWERLAIDRDARRYPPPGQLIDIGGRSLHYEEAGNGPVTVVLEAGLAGDTTNWDRVFPLLADITHVIRYDRAGMGWSDAGPLPRTAANINEDLAQLLAAVAPNRRFVLVGHSRGGIWQRLFAATCADRVEGLVLIDSNSEYELDEPVHAVKHRRLSFALRTMSSVPVARRLTALAAHRRAARLEASDITPSPAMIANLISPKGATTFGSELAETANTCQLVKQTRGTALDPALPVVVVSRGYQGKAELAESEARFQRDLAALTRNTLHVVAPDCGHLIPLSSPHLVRDAVGSVLERAMVFA